jgi:hypothetical protein
MSGNSAQARAPVFLRGGDGTGHHVALPRKVGALLTSAADDYTLPAHCELSMNSGPNTPNTNVNGAAAPFLRRATTYPQLMVNSPDVEALAALPSAVRPG